MRRLMRPVGPWAASSLSLPARARTRPTQRLRRHRLLFLNRIPPLQFRSALRFPRKRLK